MLYKSLVENYEVVNVLYAPTSTSSISIFEDGIC